MALVDDVVEDWIGEAREALARWGSEDWRQRQLGGYARETLEQVLADYRMVPRASGMRREPEKPEIIEIDGIVSQLARQPNGGDKARAALWLWYAVRKIEAVPSHDQWGQERDPVKHEGGRLTEKECSELMKCSRAQFRAWREMGLTWVAAALSRRE